METRLSLNSLPFYWDACKNVHHRFITEFCTAFDLLQHFAYNSSESIAKNTSIQHTPLFEICDITFLTIPPGLEHLICRYPLSRDGSMATCILLSHLNKNGKKINKQQIIYNSTYMCRYPLSRFSWFLWFSNKGGFIGNSCLNKSLSLQFSVFSFPRNCL